MANAVEKVNNIAIADIEAVNGITDANLQALNGLEFTGSTTVTEAFPDSAEMASNQEAQRLYGGWLARSGVLNKVLISLNDNNGKYKLIVANMNGTSAPSIASTTDFPTIPGADGAVDTDPNTDNEAVIAWTDGADNDDGKVARVTVDAAAESISYGSTVEFSSDASDSIQIAHDKVDAGRFMITWRDKGSDGSERRIYAIAGSTSGTTITLGSSVEVADPGYSPGIAADPNNARKCIVKWQDNDSPYYQSYRILTADTARSITQGTIATDDVGLYSIDSASITFDHKTANKVHTINQDRDNSHYPTLKGMTISGTDITLGTKETAESQAGVEGLNITSDYFIANAGTFMRERGSGAEDIDKCFAWTVDGTDYTVGTALDLTGTGASSRCAAVASPYTAGLHLMIYSEADSGDMDLTLSTMLLGGSY